MYIHPLSNSVHRDHLFPVKHVQLSWATVPVTSSPYSDTERSSLYSRVGNWKGREWQYHEKYIKKKSYRYYWLCISPTLADKSDNMLDFRGNTSSNRAGAWSRHEFALIFPTTQQSSAFSKSPRTSSIAASGATNVKNAPPPYLQENNHQPQFTPRSQRKRKTFLLLWPGVYNGEVIWASSMAREIFLGSY